MSIFTKRHYEFIAKEFRTTVGPGVSAGTFMFTISRISDALERDNPKFDRAKFISACLSETKAA